MLHDIHPHSFHIEYSPRKASADDFLICCRSGMISVRQNENGISFPKACETRSPDKLIFLFSIDEIGFFSPSETSFSDCIQLEIRQLRHTSPQWLAFAGVVGSRLCEWYEDSRFCGRCSSAMTHSATERAMCCPKCGRTVYPVISPSAIIAVTNGDKLLLTRYQQSHSVYRHYALCAGYIETGEAAEDAVRRELMEEVGLRVKNIRYYKSQPWPFSGALLLGYFCEVDGDDTITLDESELSEAVWVERSELPDRSGDVSLTSEMMEQFRLGLI